ncbi:hypothetical protein LBMAG48_08310 [Phycisphaerae bacterium]|nr:hypothetical protein LBMAG48_08310 [Phycisphaerae bacterium]
MVQMQQFPRITHDPQVMGGKACIRGLRVTVATIVGLVASGKTIAEIVVAYPYIDEADVKESLAYASWRLEEIDVPLSQS